MSLKVRPREHLVYQGARTVSVVSDGVTFWAIIGNIRVGEVTKEQAGSIKDGVYPLK